MNILKKSAVVVVLSLVTAAPCLAAGCDVAKDAFYGGVSGGLIGAAALLFTKKAADHLEYLGYGAAGGAAVGAAYGTVRGMRSLAEVEDGKVRFSIPIVVPDFQESNSKGKTPIVVMARLVHGRF